MTYIPQPVPVGATHYCKSNDRFYRSLGNIVEIYRGEDCWAPSLMAHREIHNNPNFVALSQQATTQPEEAGWGGGLPPVGTICKFVGDTSVRGVWHQDLEHGVDVEIIAHFKIGNVLVAAFVFDKYSSRYVQQGVATAFAPITQGELEERAAKKDMQSVIDSRGSLSVVDALYVAGYKKGE